MSNRKSEADLAREAARNQQTGHFGNQDLVRGEFAGDIGQVAVTPAASLKKALFAAEERYWDEVEALVAKAHVDVVQPFLQRHNLTMMSANGDFIIRDAAKKVVYHDMSSGSDSDRLTLSGADLVHDVLDVEIPLNNTYGVGSFGVTPGALAAAAAPVQPTVAERTQEALDIAVSFGQIEGDHHRAWTIDQIVRKLTGDDYDRFIAEANDGEDGPDTYSWDVGVAP